jgi:hypothetical protein
MVIASYDVVRRGLLLYLASAGVVGGLAVGLFALLAVKDPVFFAVAVFAIGAFQCYHFGFRQISRVELVPGTLRWRRAVGGGEVPLGDVSSIRCAKVPRRGRAVDVVTVEFARRRPLKFNAVKPGLAEFLCAVHDANPQVTLEAPIT